MDFRIKDDIVNWNNRFPLDHWWREKHKIPYLSAEHRESTFFGQYFEFYEDNLYKKHRKGKEEEKKKDDYSPIRGNWWKGNKIPKTEVDDWFNTPV